MRRSEAPTKVRIFDHALQRIAKRVMIERDAGAVSVEVLDIVLQGSLAFLFSRHAAAAPQRVGMACPIGTYA